MFVSRYACPRAYPEERIWSSENEDPLSFWESESADSTALVMTLVLLTCVTTLWTPLLYEISNV